MEMKMVDNQHQKIKGYRDLTQEEINLINECKQKAVECGQLCDKLQATIGIDPRWFAIGKTDLQKGFMSIIRSIRQA